MKAVRDASTMGGDEGGVEQTGSAAGMMEVVGRRSIKSTTGVKQQVLVDARRGMQSKAVLQRQQLHLLEMDHPSIAGREKLQDLGDGSGSGRNE